MNMGSTRRTPAKWFFDVVSPFSYLHLAQFDRLRRSVDVQPVPVLFAGLLKHWQSKGPAELPSKRLHTYRFCTWTAARLGIPFQMPGRHPFNPLSVMRLLVAVGAGQSVVMRAFEFIYAQGRDPQTDWPVFCAQLGVANADTLIADPAVKQQLLANTEEAANAGVFGVPTFKMRDALFWGGDTIDWMNAFVDDPLMFEKGEMQRAELIQFGVHRRADK
jgi:2-hydroxychromene-2-carboxylate isomerase